MLIQKDEEIAKLREDNSNMYKDLKEYCMSEETLKIDLHEHKTRRTEAE
jgi:hypothetical protein